MSTPGPHNKRRRLSAKLHTSRSEYGLRVFKEDLDENDATKRYASHLQRLSLNFNLSEEEDRSDNLDVLINDKWRVYRVSPLNNFSYKTVRLKQYGKRLREGLSTLQSDSTQEAFYDVKFDVEEGLAQTEHDKEAIKITVTLTRDKEKKLLSSFYLGYLISRGSMKSMEQASMTHLPVLLCRGTVRMLRSVHLLIQKFFDCFISPLRLTQEDMMWICALVAEEKDLPHVELHFTFPQLSVKNNITFKIPHENLVSLWEHVHDMESEFASYKEVKLFQDALWHQLAIIFEIDVGQAQLVCVNTRSLSITTDCRLSAKLNKTMSQILSILYDACTVLDSCVPTMCVQ